MKKILLLALAIATSLSAESAPKFPDCPPSRVDASTLEGKFMFGYQGWFGYPGDGSENNAWFHWRYSGTDKVKYNTDMLPDTSEYGADELAPLGLARRDGSPFLVYSAFNSKTVERHFEWMRQYGLDGVFLQRFIGELSSSPQIRAFRDEVTSHVRAAAEKNGRVFAIMYDMSGDANALEDIKKDWAHLVHDLHVTSSPSYLRHKGKPVLAVWGLGFERNIDAGQAAALIAFLKENPNTELRVTLLGGVPTHWRTLNGDSLPDPGWAQIYRSLDVISPWSVGRFADLRGADSFLREDILPDLAETKKAGAEYMPVLFPGYTAHNLSDGKKPLNEIRRQGGAFFWHQVYNAIGSGAKMFYGAMFDEVDEGTAFYKVVPDSGLLPTEKTFVSLDADGYVLPSDWYLKLAGAATMAMQHKFEAGLEMPFDSSRPGQVDGCFYCASGKAKGSGKIISINFVGGGALGPPAPMAQTEEAGVVKAAFWNNAEFNAGSVDSLMDDAGNLSGASLQWQAPAIWSTPITERMGDARMMKGYLDSPEGSSVTVEVKGLPQSFSSGYSVYVYSNGDDAQDMRRAVFSLGGQSIEMQDPPQSFFDGKFIQAEPGASGNVVVFKGLKGASFTLSATPGLSNGQTRRSPINAIQIVAK